ncbi:MAG: metal-dependent hydrolase [Sphingobacteriales bacterium 50-39]|nr:DinB family protein [Sphingobacteriales bacterium]OJW61057.1 MAG: metal-dependent hydrolase [Sphingobacteriales bacterium 50-39]
MKAPILPEVWLRGPLPAIPSLLQPVAHALLQAREEVMGLMEEFPEELLWERPAGVASPGFHLQHLSGVLDRLFTYARGESLDQGQLEALVAEVKPGPGLAELLKRFDHQVDLALRQLETTSEEELTQVRGVGRARIPSTVLGLLFHGAEHTQRHNGQLLVTVKVLLGEKWHSGNPPVKDGV